MGHAKPRRACRPVPFSVVVGAILVATGARGMEVDTGNPDLNVRLDTTLKYSAAVRTKEASPILTSAAAGNPNTLSSDDGDRNFRRWGLISNRVDVLSEFDVTYRKNFGARISGAGWYDDVYNRRNDNDSPATANSLSVLYNEFTRATRDLHGRKAEVLDAFVFANADLGDVRAQGKVGRHTLLWGESLFFAQNGIASGQAPVDVVKLLSVPASQAKEFLLPVGQASGQIQFTPEVALAGYYQFEWRRTRLPAAGSYFSTADILDAGGEALLFAPAQAAYLRRGPDLEPPRHGQYGVALKMRTGASDIGLYALQYHAKAPVLYGNLVPGPGAEQGTYYEVFPQKVKMFGASANYTIGSFNVAAEASVRQNAPLTSLLAMSFMGQPAGDANRNPLYAVGKSAHINVNTLAFFGPTFIATSSVLLAEVAWNRMLSCERNCNTALDPGATRDSWGFRATFSPTYYGVMDGLDLSPAVSASYFPKGKSAAQTLGPNRGGDATLSVDATYLAVWRGALIFTHYYGPADAFFNAASTYSFAQSLKDRDFISITLNRTF